MPKELPSVSVIIPTYNRAAFIEDSVNSVLQQTGGFKIEVIVVDDGSTDGTEELMRQFKDKVIYRKIPNSGKPAVPRNMGIDLASYELIAFQDSDDLWVEDKLNRQLGTMADPHVVLCYGNALIMDSNGKKTSQTIIPKGSGQSGQVFGPLLKENFVSTLTVLTRKSALTAAGGFDESDQLRGVEDYDLWLRLSRMGKFAYIDAPIALHRRHKNNISHTIQYAANEHILAVYKSVLGQSLSLSERRLVHSAIAHTLDMNARRTGSLSAAKLTVQASYRKLRSKLI